MEPELSVFTAFLKRRSLKLTEQRRRVLERALGEPKHFSAEQLLTDLKKEDASTSKATVYRTLALLVASHLFDAVDFERGYKLYERALGHMHHDHLICTDCGKIVEFHDEAIEQAQTEVASQHHFEVSWHVHKLYGLCQACRKKAPSATEARGSIATRGGRRLR
jgi:Fur family ferric uptake transcriptional regulator